VEKVLYEDDGVLEAAAVGIPDTRLGEIVAALVTVKPTHKEKATSASLMKLARKRFGISPR
jgi:acyl-coenzyme A synthetase/AMP-(fatty) acid ligase